MGRIGAQRRWGPPALVITAVLLTAVAVGCGSGSDDEAGSADPPPTLPTTTSTVVLNESAARGLEAQAALSGTLAGLSEDPAAASEEADDWTSCGQPLAAPDERMLTTRRAFYPPGTTAPEDLPPDEFVEVVVTTVVHRTVAAATTAVAATFDLLETCPATLDPGQLTEGWAPAPIPAGVSLDARAAGATMTVTSTGTEFPTAYGCVTNGAVVQCISVWTLSSEATAQWFDRTFTATSQHLADAMVT
jgi:hypothetical protein